MILDQLKEKDYNSFEICFNVKIRRKGIMKFLENIKLLKPKTDYYAVIARDLNKSDIIMGNTHPNTELTNIKINGLR